MGYIDPQAELALDYAFVYQVRLALVKACIAVCSEAYGGTNQPSDAQHRRRAIWATQVLRDPEVTAIRAAWGVASNAAITAASKNSDIEFQVNAMFDAYAGVVD